jgi:hypothetical protein
MCRIREGRWQGQAVESGTKGACARKRKGEAGSGDDWQGHIFEGGAKG